MVSLNDEQTKEALKTQHRMSSASSLTRRPVSILYNSRNKSADMATTLAIQEEENKTLSSESVSKKRVSFAKKRTSSVPHIPSEFLMDPEPTTSKRESIMLPKFDASTGNKDHYFVTDDIFGGKPPRPVSMMPPMPLAESTEDVVATKDKESEKDSSSEYETDSDEDDSSEYDSSEYTTDDSSSEYESDSDYEAGEEQNTLDEVKVERKRHSKMPLFGAPQPATTGLLSVGAPATNRESMLDFDFASKRRYRPSKLVGLDEADALKEKIKGSKRKSRMSKRLSRKPEEGGEGGLQVPTEEKKKKRKSKAASTLLVPPPAE
jgi:hypothetical protein